MAWRAAGDELAKPRQHHPALSGTDRCLCPCRLASSAACNGGRSRLSGRDLLFAAAAWARSARRGAGSPVTASPRLLLCDLRLDRVARHCCQLLPRCRSQSCRRKFIVRPRAPCSCRPLFIPKARSFVGVRGSLDAPRRRRARNSRRRVVLTAVNRSWCKASSASPTSPELRFAVRHHEASRTARWWRSIRPLPRPFIPCCDSCELLACFHPCLCWRTCSLRVYLDELSPNRISFLGPTACMVPRPKQSAARLYRSGSGCVVLQCASETFSLATRRAMNKGGRGYAPAFLTLRDSLISRASPVFAPEPSLQSPSMAQRLVPSHIVRRSVCGDVVR